MSSPLIPSENPVDNQSPKRAWRIVGDRLIWLVIFIGLFLNLFAFLPSESPYALSYALWYADFRFWSSWVSGCCWLLFLWACVSVAVSLFVPQHAERFFLQHAFLQKVLAVAFAFFIWVVWYNYATLSIATVFSPILAPLSNYLDTHYTLPLADCYTVKEGWSPALLPTLFVLLVAVAFVAWRSWHYVKLWKKPTAAIAALCLIGFLPTMLGADVPAPPKVATSVGIYDVQSKDDLLKFSAEEIHELVRMEDERSRRTTTPHPVLVYCFEERSFHYTGGKYDNAEIKYRLRVPNKIVSGRKYPLVVHLHGVGEAGRDNMHSLGHLHSILPLLMGPDQQDFYLLILQCPPEDRVWAFKPTNDGNLDVAVAATEHVINNNPIDERRLSIFGLSSGGHGVWQWLMKEPNRFAAAVPASCSAPNNAQRLASLTGTSIWTFYNRGDNGVSIESIRQAMRAINGSGGFMKQSRLDQGGHSAWRPAMDEYNCFSWMIAQKRGGWFNPPPEREVYQYRSLVNSFCAFFLPLGLAAGLLVFRRSPHCNQLHERIVTVLYRSREIDHREIDHRKINNKKGEKTEPITAEQQLPEGFRKWSKSDGSQSAIAKFVGFQSDGKAILQSPAGKTLAVPVSLLGQEEQEFLAKQQEQPADESFPDGFREWNNLSGTRVIVAKLVDFQDDKARFELQNGQRIATPIQQFSVEDQVLLTQMKNNVNPPVS